MSSRISQLEAARQQASSSSSTFTPPSSVGMQKSRSLQHMESDEEDTLWAIPSDHFLAQQGSKAAAHAAHRSVSPSSHTAYESATSWGEPLAELASALPMSGFTLQGPSPLPFATTAEGTAAAAAETGMPDTSTLAAADFDIDVRSGFLPPEAPLDRLEGSYAVWEEALDMAKAIPLMQFAGGLTYSDDKRRQARQWRRNVREMAVLPLNEELLGDIRHARRAHLVLSFLAHFYMHSQPAPSPNAAARPAPRSWRSYLSSSASEAEAADAADAAAEARGDYAATVPASLAVPWVGLSQHLDLPPVLTYATTVLWNWTYIDASKGLVPGNVRIATTFTGTPSEEHFYLVSLEIEMRGVEALELMRVSLDEAFVSDSLARRRIAHYLQRLAKVVDELTLLLRSMRQGCDPATFYWGIRPWFRGGDSAPEGSNGEKGWHFQGVDAAGVRRLFTGPSAGQSSLIHALDVFLDVDHSRTKPRVGRPHPRRAPADARNEREAGADADSTFMERMQLYMPGHHRAFLTHLRNLSFDDLPDGPPAPISPTHLQGDSTDAMELDDDDAHSDAGSTASSSFILGPTHPIRSLALAAAPPGKSDSLQSAYDGALLSLRALRDEHMRIATLYIISQARGVPPAEYAPLPAEFTGAAAAAQAAPVLETLAMPPVVEQAEREGAKGTGGTDLVSFLKDCRTNTLDALLKPAAAMRK